MMHKPTASQSKLKGQCKERRGSGNGRKRMIYKPNAIPK
jgi:hypothetical protein